MASGLILASKGFNCIVGHAHMPELIAALQVKFEKAKGAIDSNTEDAA